MAVDSITRGLAVELGPRKIRVNAVNPDFTVTEGIKAMDLEADRGEVSIAATPLGRYGQPADVASVVVFLASDDAGWITGESIRVAGGLL